MASAVPTWIAQYEKAMEENKPHGDAVFEAERAVRRAHGSTAVTNRPMAMQSISPWFTSVYNFFNDDFNRITETVWRAGDTLKLIKAQDYEAAKKQAAHAATGLLIYSIWPAVVESYVSPQDSKPDDSWGKRAAKAMLFSTGATMPYARDVINGLLQGKNPDVGLFSTAYKELTDIIRDLQEKNPMSPTHASKMIRDAGAFASVLTGVPQLASKEASFAYGLATGAEHPRGPWGWLVGGRYGTIKGHSATWEDYLAGRSTPNR
jgi:hypothetical protein